MRVLRLRESIDKLLVKPDDILLDVMRRINETGLGLALVVDQSRRLIGVVTDGDIRRAILKGVDLKVPVSEVMNREPIVAKSDREHDLFKLLNDAKLKRRLPLYGYFKVPLLDEDGRVRDLLLIPSEEAKPLSTAILTANEEKQYHLQYLPSKILVIGGAGYIGSTLVRKLLNLGHYVVVLDNLLYGDIGIHECLSNERFTLIRGDVNNVEAVLEAAENVDAIVHLAAIVGDAAATLNPKRTLLVNQLSISNVIEVCKLLRIPRLIFASTCSVYGYSQGLVTEDSEIKPLSLYARTKAEAERMILARTDEYFAPCILRLATVYGYSPRMRFDLVVNKLIAQALVEGEIVIHGGGQWRPFIHVEDVADAIIQCLKAPLKQVKDQIFNVGSDDQNYRLLDLGKMICSLIPGTRLSIKEEVVDHRSYRVSFKKIRETLGFRAKRNLKDAVVEIKAAFEKGLVKDYKDPIYSNHESLHEQILAA